MSTEVRMEAAAGERLPALVQVAELIPAADLERLNSFDTDYAQLLELAEAKNLLPRTIDSIKTNQERLYHERADIWKVVKLYDDTIPEAEAAIAETGPKAWLRGKITQQAADQGRRLYDLAYDGDAHIYFAKTGTYNYDAAYHKDEEWLWAHGLFKSDHPERNAFRDKVRSAYRAWLESNAVRIGDEIGQFFDDWAENLSDDELRGVIEKLENTVHDDHLQEIDGLFKEHAAVGIAALQHIEPQQQQAETKRHLGKRVLRREVKSTHTHQPDAKAQELALFSDIFAVADALGRKTAEVKVKQDPAALTNSFREQSGVGVFETPAYTAARARAIELVNARTIEVFLSQFEDEASQISTGSSVWYKFDTTIASAQPAEHAFDTYKDDPNWMDAQMQAHVERERTRQSKPVRATHGQLASLVAFNNLALEPENTPELISEVSQGLSRNNRQPEIEEAAILELCRQAIVFTAEDGSDNLNARKLMRQYVMGAHPDFLRAQGLPPESAESLARSAIALKTLFNNKLMTIDRADGQVQLMFFDVPQA